jgi:hypothetical protein
MGPEGDIERLNRETPFKIVFGGRSTLHGRPLWMRTLHGTAELASDKAREQRIEHEQRTDDRWPHDNGLLALGSVDDCVSSLLRRPNRTNLRWP